MGLFHLILLIFLFVFLLAAASEDTALRKRFNFPSFSAEDDNILVYGDAAYNTANNSYIMNANDTLSRGSCGSMSYGKETRIQDVATGRVASFSMSFSFTFTTHDLPRDNNNYPEERSGLFLVFIRHKLFARMQDFTSEIGRLGACRAYRRDVHQAFVTPGFNMAIATDFNPNLNEPSNNYIRIGKNLDFEYDIQAYTHNLCGNDTHCSYFTNGRIFTAWIDFTNSSQTLEVRLANGSNSSVKKPLQPLLLIPNYKMSEVFGDIIHPTISGSSDANRFEAHEILSWSFFSSDISDSVLPSSQTLLDVWEARTWTGITTGVLGMVAAGAVVILWSISRLARLSKDYRYATLGHTAGPHGFSYAELRKATGNFDERNLLGSGGSGSVYRGSFQGPNGPHFVAVKQINLSEPKQAESIFHAEVSSLCQIRHRNVVQLQGWCQEKGRLLLVYDYMPNGGLNEWLHGSGRHDLQHQQVVLSLKLRQSILEGVGAALKYLHEDCLSCVLHRDIKSSNVLLDADFKAHLGDFGLARLMYHHKLHKSTLAAGTLGYMAPEMPYTGKATKESDVYSFGILVLEIMCGRYPLNLQAMELEDVSLLHTVWRAYEGGSLFNVVDSRLLQTIQSSKSTPLQDNELIYAIRPPSLPSHSYSLNEGNNCFSTVVDIDVTLLKDVEVQKTMVINLLRLGLLCCLPNPKARPCMGQVNGILQQIRDMENVCAITTIEMPSLPTTKPFGLYQSLEFSQTTVSSTSYVPTSISSISSNYDKSSINNSTLQQGFDIYHKDD